ncbi:MAG: cyclic nucleotide-binding domain-containing protein, partial [Planctomycetota bacterium]
AGLPAEVLGRVEGKRKNLFSAFAQLWSNSKHSEARNYSDDESYVVGRREGSQGTRMFLHDIPRVIRPTHSESMVPGEIFGELSALTRTPRSATVVANKKSRLLEIRWQGLRDLMKWDPSLKRHVESLYRENSLKTHLREVDLFSKLDANHIDEIAAETEFETYGKFQWNLDYRSTQKKDVSERILDEPVIVKQGDYVNGLFLIRNGFVRICRDHGKGIQTVAYMGKGGVFGMREIVHNWKHGEQRAWALSLRAVGYVDVLHIPVPVVEKHALQFLNPEDLPATFADSSDPANKEQIERRRGLRRKEMERGLLEFLVEERFTNGTKAMMIDLNRCTRCDDCVRACASTHNNNPRFVREGPIHDHWMLANACMHCIDPVCMIGCPTGAIGRDFESGNVTINDATCIGCSTCANSCPYNNIRMVQINDASGKQLVDRETQEPIMKATKCDFCTDQLGGPACQRACPHDALVRIDLTEPSSVTHWTKV